MWKVSPTKILFQTRARERNKIVLQNAYAIIDADGSKKKVSVQPSGGQSKSVEVFRHIDALIKSNASLRDEIGAIFQFNIKAGGLFDSI